MRTLISFSTSCSGGGRSTGNWSVPLDGVVYPANSSDSSGSTDPLWESSGGP